VHYGQQQGEGEPGKGKQGSITFVGGILSTLDAEAGGKLTEDPLRSLTLRVEKKRDFAHVLFQNKKSAGKESVDLREKLPGKDGTGAIWTSGRKRKRKKGRRGVQLNHLRSNLGAKAERRRKGGI